MYENLLKPLLFRLDPERAHHLTLHALRIAAALPFGLRALQSMFSVEDPRLAVEAFGLTFKNRVGLAAGYDKNGVAVSGLSALGFGHVEVGTVTRMPQPGNARPRVHRVREAQGVINSMGFPNEGVEKLIRRRTGDERRIRSEFSSAVSRPPSLILGINIGKGKDTPVERAAEDYCALLQQVVPYADYVAINISSPNTMNLRQLQAKSFIVALLGEIAATRSALSGGPRAESSGAWSVEREAARNLTNSQTGKLSNTPPQPPKPAAATLPLLVKIAPDLSEGEIDDVLDAIAQAGIDGVIATNTTLARAGLPAYAQSLKGGLSGAPLTARSTEVIRYIAKRTLGKLPIIGVGGIMTPRDALDKIDAGATLVQVYTGMIYAGPGLVREINKSSISIL